MCLKLFQPFPCILLIPEPVYFFVISEHVRLSQTLKSQKKQIEAEVDRLASEAARDLGLELGKTLKLEWHK